MSVRRPQPMQFIYLRRRNSLLVRLRDRQASKQKKRIELVQFTNVHFKLARRLVGYTEH